jgi:hypothetical protein
MPLYDTAPFSSLYGSFVDNYFTGSSLRTNPNRGPVVSVVSSTLDPNVITNTLLNPVNYNDSFTEYRTAVTQSKTIINKNIRFLQAVSQNEYYYDSFIPDINGIFAVDGGKLLLMNNGQQESKPIYDFEYLFGTVINGILNNVTSSTGTQVSNDKWLYSYPYQIKYRNLIRLRGNPFTLSTLTYAVSGNLLNQNAIEIYEDTPFNIRNIDQFPPTGSGTFWNNNNLLFTFGSSAEIVFGFLFPSGALPTSPSSTKYTAGTDFNFKGIIADKSVYASASTDYQGASPPTLALTASTLSTNLKFVYGFGDGFAGFGEFITNTVHTINDYAMSSVFFGSLIRGWKYGLKSGFPEQTKVLIDRNFYGGFYSMLGSRPNAVFYNNKTGQITYPIQIQFLSGTQAYVTNSNPSTLNTRESGIFDTFYRVGIPFYEA